MNKFIDKRTTPKQRGFTLIELMIVVVIIVILATIVFPSYQDSIERRRLKGAVEAFKSDLQLARATAIKRSLNVHVSRVAGENGAWCYGLNYSSNCDCRTAGSCSIKTISGAQFSERVSMLGNDGSNIFNFRRGTTNAGGVTFSTQRYQARVVFSDAGRIRICTPSGANGLPEYPNC